MNNYLKHLQRLLDATAKVKDPVTRQPVLNQGQLEKVTRRKPRPMTDREFADRLVHLTP